MEASTAKNVTIVWLSGKEEKIGDFETVGQVKIHLLKTMPEAFLPDCVVLAPDYQVLDIDAEVLPVMHVIFQELKPRKNMQEWREAITLHHKLEGFEGIKRIGRRIERDGFIDVADVFGRQLEFRVFLAVQTQDVNRLCDLVGYESHLNLPGIYTLVAAKGDPNADIGGSILLHAIYNRDLEAVNFLIEHEVDVSLPGNHWCKERLLPLNAAADLASCGPGDLSIVKALLNANASVHQRGPNDKTVLEHFIESQRWMHQMPDARMKRLMKVHYLLEEARRATPLPEGERDISIIRFDLFPPRDHKLLPYKWEDNTTLITSRLLDPKALDAVAMASTTAASYYNRLPPSDNRLPAPQALFYNNDSPSSATSQSEKRGANMKMKRDSRRNLLYGGRAFVGGHQIIHQRWKVLEHPENVSTGTGGSSSSSSSSIGMNDEDIIAIPYRGRGRLSVYEDNLTMDAAALAKLKNHIEASPTTTTTTTTTTMGLDDGEAGWKNEHDEKDLCSDRFIMSNNQNEDDGDDTLAFMSKSASAAAAVGPRSLLTSADHDLVSTMASENLDFLSEDGEIPSEGAEAWDTTALKRNEKKRKTDEMMREGQERCPAVTH